MGGPLLPDTVAAILTRSDNVNRLVCLAK